MTVELHWMVLYLIIMMAFLFGFVIAGLLLSDNAEDNNEGDNV